jgi:hypothetical protein
MNWMQNFANKHPQFYSSPAIFIPSTLPHTFHLIYSIINIHLIITLLIQSRHDTNNTAVYVGLCIGGFVCGCVVVDLFVAV